MHGETIKNDLGAFGLNIFGNVLRNLEYEVTNDHCLTELSVNSSD